MQKDQNTFKVLGCRVGGSIIGGAEIFELWPPTIISTNLLWQDATPLWYCAFAVGMNRTFPNGSIDQRRKERILI